MSIQSTIFLNFVPNDKSEAYVFPIVWESGCLCNVIFYWYSEGFLLLRPVSACTITNCVAVWAYCSAHFIEKFSEMRTGTGFLPRYSADKHSSGRARGGHRIHTRRQPCRALSGKPLPFQAD